MLNVPIYLVDAWFCSSLPGSGSFGHDVGEMGDADDGWVRVGLRYERDEGVDGCRETR